MQESGKRVLPEPGAYTIVYTATMLNRGGKDYHRTMKSPVFKYTAISGPAHQCELLGWPNKIRLGTLRNAMHIRLKDRAGNPTKVAGIPEVQLSSGQVDISCEVGQWRQATDDIDELQLAILVMRPTQAFQPRGADKPVVCDVKLQVALDKSVELTADYKIEVFAGMSAADSCDAFMHACLCNQSAILEMLALCSCTTFVGRDEMSSAGQQPLPMPLTVAEHTRMHSANADKVQNENSNWQHRCMIQCIALSRLDFVGPPARLEANLLQSCFSLASEEPKQDVENHAEGPDIPLSLLDIHSHHTVSSPSADRYVCLSACCIWNRP